MSVWIIHKKIGSGGPGQEFPGHTPGAWVRQPAGADCGGAVPLPPRISRGAAVHRIFGPQRLWPTDVSSPSGLVPIFFSSNYFFSGRKLTMPFPSQCPRSTGRGPTTCSNCSRTSGHVSRSRRYTSTTSVPLLGRLEVTWSIWPTSFRLPIWASAWPIGWQRMEIRWWSSTTFDLPTRWPLPKKPSK